jgi:superfamily II DNA or RNA helicase
LIRAPLDLATAALKREARTYADGQRTARLAAMPVEALKEVGVTGVRWAALRDGGIHTVADLAQKSPAQLLAIPGVGATTVESVLTAAQQVREKVLQEPVSLPSPETLDVAGENLVRSAATALRAREALADIVPALEKKQQLLRARIAPLLQATSLRQWLFGGRDKRDTVLHDAQQLVKDVEAADVSSLIRAGHEQCEQLRTSPTGALLDDFRARYADYCAVIESALEDVPATTVPDRERIEGGLPQSIARQVEGLTLRTDGLRVTLRRYQEFGAKYLIVQQKTILGDEMGLGKTIQALAAMVHLDNTETPGRFLVVAPASILSNWLREIHARTSLPVLLLHGAERHRPFLTWLEQGGVAVTSYETFRSDDVDGALARRNLAVDLLIVDEAHYIKNPSTGRSQAAKEILPHARRVCLMTGTPLENRLEEFHTLVGLLTPEVVTKLRLINAGFTRLGLERQRFHETIAPVYLRRNQEDVLRELPEKIEKEEWVDLSPEDNDAYKAAVRAKNMMAMRRTATLGKGEGRSAKLARLGELLDEYRESEQKILVFSFFLDVLAAVGNSFGAGVVITGDISPAQRLRIVDEFQQAPGFRLLPCQIQAGGVGLNLQAASVVILMEPQWKATAEDQAIARAHRMGQTRRVVVHRLLARNSVDERMLEILRGKREVFETYARDSLIKEASTEATETQMASAIIEAELERIRREESV